MRLGLGNIEHQEWREDELRHYGVSIAATYSQRSNPPIDLLRSEVARLSIQPRTRSTYHMSQEELDAFAKDWLDAVGWSSGDGYAGVKRYLTLDQYLDMVQQDEDRDKIDGEQKEMGG